MTVCLFVVGIIGTYCAVDAQPIGICHPADENHIYCTVDLQELPARASWYNPVLGHINCYEDTCDFLGDGTLVRDGYGKYIACPMGMYGEFVTFEWAGTWQCRDHGGAIKPTWGRWYTADGFVEKWVITFDFLLESEAPFTYAILDIENVSAEKQEINTE